MGRVRSRNQMGQGDIEENFDRRTQKVCQKIRTEVVFESCSSWTSRLHRLSINNGSYLR